MSEFTIRLRPETIAVIEKYHLDPGATIEEAIAELAIVGLAFMEGQRRDFNWEKSGE